MIHLDARGATAESGIGLRMAISSTQMPMGLLGAGKTSQIFAAKNATL